jgi:hypothetical protein
MHYSKEVEVRQSGKVTRLMASQKNKTRIPNTSQMGSKSPDEHPLSTRVIRVSLSEIKVTVEQRW